MLESLDLSTLITIVLGLIGTFAGGFWLKAKGKLKQVVVLGSEAFDVIEVLEKALQDDKIDKKEIEALKKEAKEVRDAWKKLTAKE
jgi:hypothetical protein